ncbi:MAG: GtrA family protein [Streptosporangiaceae bacterium]
MGTIVSLNEHLAARRRGPLGLLTAVYLTFRQLIHEVTKFGLVGATGAVIDIGGNNLLHFGLGAGPLTSKTISLTAAATFAYAGNRYWTFRHRQRTNLAREYFLYFVLNGVGLLIALLCVGFTEYILKIHGPLAYNLSANVFGLGLGTLFRYWSYKKWVFLPPEDPPVDPHTGLPEAPHGTREPPPDGRRREAR